MSSTIDGCVVAEDGSFDALLLLGSDISLCSGVAEQADLELAESKIYGDGIVLLRYWVRS